MKKEKNIDNYWQKNSPAFSNQYNSLLGIPLSPVGLFLLKRFNKINAMMKTVDGKIFLDVGCGSGIFMVSAIKQGKYAIGVDYSNQMIKIAEKNICQFPKNKYKLVVGNATKLPCPDASVDIVLASGLTDYLNQSEVGIFMKEIKRVLKKGAIAIITYPKKDSPFFLLRRGFGLFLRMFFLRLPPMQTSYSKDDIISLCKQASLKPLEWDDVFFTMRIVMSKRV